MTVKNIVLLILMLWFVSAAAQKITLTGKITDASTGKALSSVLVTIRPEGGNKVLKFCTTKTDGSFALALDSLPAGNNVLHFSMLGYATKTLPLSADNSTYDAQLTEKATELNGVDIKAPSIREHGDTIAYNVASFADASDKSIADVLKKMPGVEVEESGRIKYNGRAINKFYIEGHDMLGGRYSIASNNIQQEDVSTVEVMTNHQPIKALEDMVFSQDPAINIKLKEAARSRWVGTLKAGGGLIQENKDFIADEQKKSSSFVWNGEMSLMRFAKKTQSLNTFKSNNIGIDVTREANIVLTDDDRGSFSDKYSLKDYVDVSPDQLADISESRVRQNKTHAFTTNNLWALSPATDVTSQIIYTHDRLVSTSISSTEYFLNDSTIVNEENEKAKQKQNKLNIGFTLTSNAEKAYVTNNLAADVSWNDVTMNVSGTYPNSQSVAMPKYKFYDDFEILLRSGKKAYTFNTYNAFLRSPHSLSIERYTEASDTSSSHQSVRSSAYFNHTYTSLGFYLQPFTVTMKLGVQVLSRHMKSCLDGVVDTTDIRNDVKMTFVKAYASPEAEYNDNGWHISFRMPISYTPYSYRDRLDGSSEKKIKGQISPHLSVNYYFNSRLEATLSGGISQEEINEQNFYQGLIMRDYRNIYSGFVDYVSDKSKSVSLNIDYKRPLATIFMNAYFFKAWEETHQTTARDFVGDYIVNSYYSDKSKSNDIMAGGRISKGLSSMHGLVTAKFDYFRFEGTLRQEDLSSDYASNNYVWTARWSGRPVGWFNFAYELSWTRDVMKMSDTDIESTYTNHAQFLTLNFNPLKPWLIKLQGDYFYNQVSESQHKGLFLSDASTSYSLKNGIELSVMAFNLFNQRKYGYTINESLTRMSKEYRLRARTVMATVFFHF